jgi:DNA-binding Xre family transcriptional regulator
MTSNLVQLMEQRGMTIRALAEQTGVSSATIQKARDSRIEQCRVGSLKKIADALGVNIQDLFADAGG